MYKYRSYNNIHNLLNTILCPIYNVYILLAKTNPILLNVLLHVTVS
jgi:hypothetical protein